MTGPSWTRRQRGAVVVITRAATYDVIGMSGNFALSAGQRYLDRLTEADRRLLAALTPDGQVDPALLPDLLRRDAIFDAVFASLASRPAHRPLVFTSPFLAFAVAIQRATADLATSTYVAEWAGPRQRVPVFDGGRLLGFGSDPWRSLFLADLLASFARVTSGSYWVSTSRGLRRRRWNELDPARLAGLLEAVPAAERAGVYRRLGDLALFLTGVFPDHTARHVFPLVEASRLLATVGGSRGRASDASPVELLEWLGGRWYRLAADHATADTSDSRLLADVAQDFRSARRLLNVVSDRYLFPAAGPWFPHPWGTGA